ncbi:MAG TPA: xanthine dehydrogenase family protein subunit M [Anaerovoracaceae bacterium]|nr:xanthine dehydrogenase family protein subunit M [Anaerovoracaceae bacterium]
MNILCDFEYHAPKTKAEALDLVASLGDKAKILAGGTDLVIQLKEDLIQTENIIDMKDVDELKGIKVEAKNGAEIGAMTTIETIEYSKELQAKYPSLTLAASTIGSNQVRVMGTIGGNCCNASPCADTVSPLCAMGGKVIITSKNGEREMAVEDFILGNRSIALETGEMVTKFVLPEPEAKSACSYDTAGLRDAMEIDLANLAAKIVMDEDGETIKDIKVVMGSVYFKPLVSDTIPGILKGKKLTDDLLVQAGQLAKEQAKPISDVRASAEYRSEVIDTLARRVIKSAYEAAKEA